MLFLNEQAGTLIQPEASDIPAVYSRNPYCQAIHAADFTRAVIERRSLPFL